MTVIALSCRNRREICEHAGPCRNFLVYRVEGAAIGEPERLALPREAVPREHGHGHRPAQGGGCGDCHCAH